MILITFSKAGKDDIILTENDLFSFEYQDSCFSGDVFELGGSSARKFQITIDNNGRRFSRGMFANCRAKLELNGKFYGLYNTELPKRRNGVIELTAYDDMVKLDTEFPTDYTFPQTFWAVYAQCVFEAGLASDISFDNVVLNGVWDNGIISADYTQYIYANSCRKLVAGMAEWNGGYAHINADNKLQIDKFSKEVSREYSSGELMELDYSDDTVTFSKVRTSQKNKTYEMGTDDGYTLVLNNQYISYGLSDENFELYLTKIYEYYSGFTLTPMSFTLAEPDFELRIGDRIKVYDEEEQISVYGNVSKIEISGNLSMVVTCGGFDSAGSSTSFTPTSFSQIQQSKQEAKAESSASEGNLTEYQYLTDASVKFNGVTYTAEKDAETGLISKISDSNGNEFEPDISAGITDVALHNAVFWAVAMCRELRQKIYGNKNIFDISTLKDGVWNNAGNGYSITLPDGTETGADGVCLKANYHLPITDTLGDYTMFVVAKMSGSMTNSDFVTVVANYGETPQFNLCTYRKCWSIGTGTYSGRHDGVISAADFAVLALRKSGATGVFFINQTQKSSYSGYKAPIKDFWDLGMNFWFKHIAIYPWSMEDSTMLAEISRLMDKYNIGGNT